MTEKKKIPCRTCGKLFTPCVYCQSHSDVFRWRNFACSIECATKYVNETIAYRETQKKRNGVKVENVEKVADDNTTTVEPNIETTKKTTRKKVSTKKIVEDTTNEADIKEIEEEKETE